MTFKAPKQIINWEKITKMFARFVQIVKARWRAPLLSPLFSPPTYSEKLKIKHAANRRNDEKLHSEVPKALFSPYKKKQIQTGLN